MGRALAGAAPEVVATLPSEIGQFADLSANSATLLGLAPLSLMPDDEAGQAWRITAGISLLVTAVGYWYCQTNPLQIRKRKTSAIYLLSITNPRDRENPFSP